MAEYTYQTRGQITEKWVSEYQARGGGLSAMEKKLLPEKYERTDREAKEYIEGLLKSGEYNSLSRIYREKLKGVTAVCVPAEDREDFYYALDQMNRYQMTAGWYRRSVRSESYLPFVSQSAALLRAYSRLQFYQASLAALLAGQADPELYDHARCSQWSYAGILAAQINRGNRETIQAVKDILLGEGNTAMISYELIRGIVMSKSEELYEVLGRFLLAARLQEGARQAVCETMDAGRPEAFLHLFRVIEENDLVRYSSVKRAVSTWIGIFDEKSVDRITGKLVQLMGQCLRDKAFLEKQLATEDSVAISCALWAKGFYDAQDAIAAQQRLIREGSRHQMMTASYFNRSLQYPELKRQAAKEVLMKYPEDLELAACFLPGFMDDASSRMRELTSSKSNGYYYRDAPVREPDRLSVTEMFESREEACKIYGLLQGILKRMPKKGVEINPCIFPWYQVSMTQSDIANRMCLIAWMLQDEEYLDEAAKLIPLIGQGAVYSGASRSIAARLLLYRPQSEARRAVLFELLHNPEEYTMLSAFSLVKDMELAAGDYEKLEQNLKYKKGRKETLALLNRQEPKQLQGSIGRLLQTRSEECHMGAFELALGLKKEHPAEFAEITSVLSEFKNPTGKEQVLLKELIGERSEAQDILNTPGYGFYDPEREWVLPPMQVNPKEAGKLFQYGEGECLRLLRQLNTLIQENKDLEYKDCWDQEQILGNKLVNSRRIYNDPAAEPLDALPFRELWTGFYESVIKTPDRLLELYLYVKCREERFHYEKNIDLYKKVFGRGLIRQPPFTELVTGLYYGAQATTVVNTLFNQYVPKELKAHWGLTGIACFLEAVNDSNSLFEYTESRWNGVKETYTKRAVSAPIFQSLLYWLSDVEEKDWGTAFTLRFKLQQHYERFKSREKVRFSAGSNYLELQHFVGCFVRGIWDKELFYKAVFTFLTPGSVLGPVSTVEQKGAVASRYVRQADLNAFFGMNAIRPQEGKYRFDNREDMPAMQLAHELYEELVPVVLKVELKRGEQPTPFSTAISSIRVIYGIDYMIQILTALGQDTLQRGYVYSSKTAEKKAVLSHLLKVCRPKPQETAKDLKKALKGTDITKKRLAELAMYAQQWIPMIEEYLELPGFQSGCYYFMAHTSEKMDEFTTSMVARYTPLSPEELGDGAFDIHWFFEAYEKLGEKNFKLLYDAAKYSSSGAAHSRARKYADAALGKADREMLKAEIAAKRNKDLLMSLGLLPLGQGREKEEALLDCYQFIQQYKKESKNFGAQRRASEGRAAELALRNLSVNAGFTDVTRLTLRMETRLTESLGGYFEWKPLEEIELKLLVDEAGRSSLLCRKGGKELKAIPAKYKKDAVVLDYQNVNKKLKEQYSRTRQMMEQAMEDCTPFEVWELLELQKNPVAGPILKPLVMKLVRQVPEEGAAAAGNVAAAVSASAADAAAGNASALVPGSILGFLGEEGLTDWTGAVRALQPSDQLLIAHPFDLYQEGHWHEYQKLLFEKQIRQPFKQVFRELYVKLEEELLKEHSMMFSGNQIQPQKTVGALRSRRWVADYEDGLQKIYYKENIVAGIYAMADWFSPSDIEAPTLEWVVFRDRKTFEPLKIKDIPDVIYSEVMRDVDLAVSVAHAGGVDPETSHSTVEMRCAIIECNLELFKIKNVRLEGSHALIDGRLGRYTVHLGSGVVHQQGNSMLFVVPVHSQHRGRMFLPFIDDDPKTAEIMSKILLFAEDHKIKDPSILAQIR